MPLAHYYDVCRELHKLKQCGKFLPTRNGIMDKFGASILLTYSGLVVSYVTRNELASFALFLVGSPLAHVDIVEHGDTIGRLRFHFDNDNEYENEIFVC